MTEFINGANTLEAIRQVFRSEGDIYAAVAYWNGEAGKPLVKMGGERLHIVLDVNAGGTSARELSYLIEKLGKKVKVHPNLHTKIYASHTVALVGSSNASVPGLHLAPTTRAEASFLASGQAAASAYSYSKELFDAAEVANQSHVEICRKRFGKKSVAESQSMEGKVDLLTCLFQRRDLLDEIPLIITYEESDPKAAKKEFKLVRPELAGELKDARHLNQSEWTDFSWKLDEEYDGKLCLSVHKLPRGGIKAALVRPKLTVEGRLTFARYQDWSEIGFLNYRDHGYRPIKGDKLDEFKDAFEKIKDGEGMIRVRDLAL